MQNTPAVDTRTYIGWDPVGKLPTTRQPSIDARGTRILNRSPLCTTRAS